MAIIGVFHSATMILFVTIVAIIGHYHQTSASYIVYYGSSPSSSSKSNLMSHAKATYDSQPQLNSLDESPGKKSSQELTKESDRGHDHTKQSTNYHAVKSSNDNNSNEKQQPKQTTSQVETINNNYKHRLISTSVYFPRRRQLASISATKGQTKGSRRAIANGKTSNRRRRKPKTRARSRSKASGVIVILSPSTRRSDGDNPTMGYVAKERQQHYQRALKQLVAPVRASNHQSTTNSDVIATHQTQPQQQVSGHHQMMAKLNLRQQAATPPTLGKTSSPQMTPAGTGNKSQLATGDQQHHQHKHHSQLNSQQSQRRRETDAKVKQHKPATVSQVLSSPNGASAAVGSPTAPTAAATATVSKQVPPSLAIDGAKVAGGQASGGAQKSNEPAGDMISSGDHTATNAAGRSVSKPVSSTITTTATNKVNNQSQLSGKESSSSSSSSSTVAVVKPRRRKQIRTLLPVGLTSWLLGGIRDLDGRHWHMPAEVVDRLLINDVDFHQEPQVSSTLGEPSTNGQFKPKSEPIDRTINGSSTSQSSIASQSNQSSSSEVELIKPPK